MAVNSQYPQIATSMNTIVQSSFDSLETALSNLVESIASYNPSPAAASAVVIADNGVAESLEFLAKHQANYQRIRILRESCDVLDQRLTQLLTALAQTRKDLLAVPSTNFPESRELPYEELLTYARKISKYTRAPNLRENAPPSSEGATGGEETRPGRGLTDEEAQMLDPSSRFPFTPWPSEEVMRRGALAHIAIGGDGAAPEGTQAPGIQQNGILDETKSPVEEKGRINGAMAGYARQQNPQDRQAREEAAAAVFSGLDLYDPDEE